MAHRMRCAVAIVFVRFGSVRLRTHCRSARRRGICSLTTMLGRDGPHVFEVLDSTAGVGVATKGAGAHVAVS